MNTKYKKYQVKLRKHVCIVVTIYLGLNNCYEINASFVIFS